MPSALTIDHAAVLWSGAPDEVRDRDLLLFLHGYGADEHDLFGLRAYLPDRFAVASLPAPLTPPFPMPGRSWYPIEGLEGRDPAGITSAAESVLAWAERNAADAASVGVLGFSQGAAVALQAMRLDPQRFAFAVALSGYVADGALPRDGELADLRPPVFWGRGTHDDVIPEAAITHTNQWLPSHVELSGRVYPGLTHSISEQELADIRVFLDKQAAEK